MKAHHKKVTRFFAALSDETRLKILLSISDKPKSVNKIHESLGKENITLSAVSHQLKNLADLEIIVYIKKGKEKTFSLSDKFCWCILRDVLKHFKSKQQIGES